MNGTRGLSALINDNNAIYVQDNSPNAEAHYRARFLFDPNTLTMANANAHYLMYGYAGTTTVVFRIEMRYSSGYQLRISLVNNTTAWSNSAWFTISDAPHTIEMDWVAATSTTTNNGSTTLWIDGVQRGSVTGINNATRRIDMVQVGAVAGIDTGTRGTEYFDAFDSHRTTYIGLVPVATPTPTLTPTATNTPLPTVTNTPLPTVTNTPLPTVTSTPLPTVTNTPLPTVTETPTSTPLPTATETPLPTVTETPTSTPLPTATNTPTSTPLPPTATRTPTSTPVPPTATRTPTNTPVPPTATRTPTPGTGFPLNTPLDTFDRANGVLGTSWVGATSGYAIATNRVNVSAGGNIYWNTPSYGASQEAYITLTTINANTDEIDLMLKAQGTTWTAGVIEVWYSPKRRPSPNYP